VPHVRNPVVLHVTRPQVSLCFLDHPVDFGALDGKPVHTLFAIVSPTVRAHLKLLSRLAYLLKDERLRRVIGEQAGATRSSPWCGRSNRHCGAATPRWRTLVSAHLLLFALRRW